MPIEPGELLARVKARVARLESVDVTGAREYAERLIARGEALLAEHETHDEELERCRLYVQWAEAAGVTVPPPPPPPPT